MVCCLLLWARALLVHDWYHYLDSRIYAVGHCGVNLEGDKLSDEPTLVLSSSSSDLRRGGQRTACIHDHVYLLAA